MGRSIIIIFCIIYFIRQQFEFNTVRKFTYFFLPLLSMYQFITHFSFAKTDFLFLLLLMIVSIMIGHFQAKYTIVRKDNVPVYYFKKDNTEHEIYQKIVKARGGRHYLIGWIIIFALQLFIQFIITRQKLSASIVWQSLYQEVFAELLSVYRLFDLEKSSTAWYVWAIYGISSLSYTCLLAKKSPMVREELFTHKKKFSYNIEDTSKKHDSKHRKRSK